MILGRKLKRVLAVPVALVVALTLAATACTPAEAEALQGILQNVDSANGKITIVTNDGKTVTLKIDTDTVATADGANATVSALKPGDEVEVEVEGKGKDREQTARKIKAQGKGKGDENEGKPAASIGSGIVELNVTDPGPAGVQSAVVSFTGIEIHRAGDDGVTQNGSVDNEGSSWIPIATDVTSFDLMDVLGVEKLIASANVSAGKYTQIRMTVTSVTGTTANGTAYEAEIPGGKLKVVGNFMVGNGDTTGLTLDFDGEKSLVQTGEGKFIFKPVVKLLVNGQEAVAGSEDDDEDGGSGKSENSGRPADAGKPGDTRTGNQGEEKSGKRD